MKLFLKLLSVFFLFGLFFSGGWIYGREKKLMSKESGYVSELIFLSNEEKENTDKCISDGTLQHLQLSLISDIDKYKIFKKYTNDENYGLTPVAEKQITHERELISIMRSPANTVTLSLIKTNDEKPSEEEKLCVRTFFHAKMTPKLITDANGMNVCYGQNYFFVFYEEGSVEAYDIFIDRVENNSSASENEVETLAGRFCVNSECSAKNELGNVTSFTFDKITGERLYIEIFDDGKSAFISFRKKR